METEEPPDIQLNSDDSMRLLIDALATDTGSMRIQQRFDCD